MLCKRLLPTLQSCLQRVPLRPFLAPVDTPTDFLVAPRLLTGVTPDWDKDNVQGWIAAQHRSALLPLSQLGISWQRCDR
ncbi:hypothetical protein WKI65_37140 [Streptomyces sp. MS1.AVA.3]|uniref:hypothetical protein n=1 Tax=Streptomyces decoyicus TaxID=249567 RepID=UPI0030C20275